MKGIIYYLFIIINVVFLISGIHRACNVQLCLGLFELFITSSIYTRNKKYNINLIKNK